MSPEDGFFMVVVRFYLNIRSSVPGGPQQGHLRWPGVSRSWGGGGIMVVRFYKDFI